MNETQSIGIKSLMYSQSLIRILGNWVEAVQSGLFMGLLSDEQFQCFDTYPFENSPTVDLTMEAELGLEPWEHRIAQQHLANKQSLLVVAAGGNRELLGFSALGHGIAGIEYAENLCKASQLALRDSQHDVTIELADRFSVPGSSDFYDGAFIARKYLSHVHDRSKRIEFLSNLRRVLKKDAILAFGYYIREHDGLSFRAQAFVANLMRKMRGRGKQIVEVGDHLDPDTPLYHHHFVLDEVRSELQQAGFELVKHENDWFGSAVARAV